MSGVIAWLTGFLVGNDDGKQMCAATIYRPYMYQAGMCAGVGPVIAAGADFTVMDDRVMYRVGDDRPYCKISG